MSDTERIKWNAKYNGEGAPRDPSCLLLELDNLLPTRGKALDLAGGGGRHAIWLARRGLDVTLADISESGLAIARAAAKEAGVHLTTVAVDLDTDPLPEGPWDLIFVFHYLNRPLFTGAVPPALAPGGLFVLIHPTRANLARHPKPGPNFLLEDGEIQSLAPDLEILRCEEGWLGEGRHEARLVAKRPVD
ncbi:MAG: class I SAM-dependent methyltransferase [Polyangiaceae bacterium]|nr:class I SAM-dependent methyltransferase [Polyangiaceae bacterium]